MRRVEAINEGKVFLRGLFHEWTIESEEVEGGSLHAPMGIVEEVSTGKVHVIYAGKLRFENRTDEELFRAEEIYKWVKE